MLFRKLVVVYLVFIEYQNSEFHKIAAGRTHR